MVLGIFRGYILKFAIIFVLHPGIKIVLVRKAMPEMVEGVKTGFAKNGYTKVN